MPTNAVALGHNQPYNTLLFSNRYCNASYQTILIATAEKVTIPKNCNFAILLNPTLSILLSGY